MNIKVIKLINNERMSRKIVSAKANDICGDATATDICIKNNYDLAHCTLSSYDLCVKDYAGCTNNSIDYCGGNNGEDYYACHTNNAEDYI